MAVTNYPREDYFESELAQDISESSTQVILKGAVQFTLAAGQTCSLFIDFDKQRKRERVIVTAIDVTGKILTVTRAANLAEGVSGTAYPHTAGANVIIGASFSDFKTLVDEKATGSPAIYGNNIYADSTARDAAIPSPANGMEVYTNSVKQYYFGGSWNDVGTSTPTADMSTSVSGKGQKSTAADAKAGTALGGTGSPNVITADVLQDSDVSTDTSAGVADAGKLVKTRASDGKIDPSLVVSVNTPQLVKFQVKSTTSGDGTTQFDITDEGDDTFRYTYDGAGTDPSISSTTCPVGTVVRVMGSNFDSNNTGSFIVTASGSNYFEVTNASGVAEDDITVGSGALYLQTGSVYIGDDTTQFDITNPSGDTHRYTYDGTGTDPVINADRLKVGDVVNIQAEDFNANNNGAFTITAVGANYFEVENASGVAETNKTLGVGYLCIGTVYNAASDVVYATVEVQGAGGSTPAYSGTRIATVGAPSGGYAKGYSVTALSAVSVFVGRVAAAGFGVLGGDSIFGSIVGGGCINGSGVSNGGDGGVASGGDINIDGQPGGVPDGDGSSSNSFWNAGGDGADSFLGIGGSGASASEDCNDASGYGSGASGGATGAGTGSGAGADGADGIVLLTEYR